MKCEKCGGEWIPPKNISVSLTNCPFCGAPILDADTAKGYTDMGKFLQYLVSLYGIDLYNNQKKLNNLIADLYQGDERMKRVYRRAILDDSLSKRIYDLSKKSLNEREAYYNQIINQFSETNFYAVDFGKQVIESFVSGLKLEIIAPISTEATKEDGEWIDEFGVKYSADRKKLIRGNESLEVYKIREGTAVICNEAFSYCTSLIGIAIPDSATSIGDSAFYLCESLTSITIPNSVTSIGNYAFEECSSLTSITIPDSVTSIGEGAFSGCENLNIRLESNKHFVIIDDILYTSDIKKIIKVLYSNKDHIDIPNSVTSIGKWAFQRCESLTSITIPNSVTSIGDYAFIGCKSLTNITIPDSVTSIGRDVFGDPNPNSVINIGHRFLRYYPSLTSIFIPKNTTEKFKKLLPQELHPLLKESSEIE